VQKEKLRWRHVQQVFDEFYKLPPSEADEEDDKECPVCGEELSLRPVRHVCCGKVECPKCLKQMQSGELETLHEWLMNNDEDYEQLDVDGKTRKVSELMHKSRNEGKAFQCVFCQQPTPASVTEYREHLEQAAQLGRAWAQNELSEFLYKEGKEDEGLEWLHKAVAQEYAPAQHMLGVRLSKQDPNESLRLLKTAACKGDAFAQCIYGNEILEQNEEEAIIMLTLSALRGVALAEREMARKFGGMKQPNEIETGIYWYERAAVHGDALSQNQLAMLLITGAENIFGSCGYPGYSPVPQAYRWVCRSLRGGYQHASETSQLFERMFCSSCAVCQRPQQFSSAKFLRCAKCKAWAYCSKTCQTKHWRDGHKLDCCDNAEPL
jgi:TPR repeat protein